MATNSSNKVVQDFIDRVVKEVNGPFLIQSDGTAVPWPDKEDRFTDEYNVYPTYSVYSPYFIGAKKYIVPDTIRGPKILRPIKHIYHDIQNRPKLINYLSIFGNTIKDYFTGSAPNIGNFQFIHNNEQKNKED